MAGDITPDIIQLLFHTRLEGGKLLLSPLPALLALLNVSAVIAPVRFDATSAHLPDGIDDLVQEIAVVADDQHGPVPVTQPIFQPLNRFHVQVVRGLVQDQQVRLFQQQARQQDARFLPAAQVVNRQLKFGGRKAQTGQHSLNPHFILISPLKFESFLGLAVPFQKLVRRGS